ncbi:MAG: TIGR03936 family radical SAM-associated protein [Firmicutes bacterium]|nr:TIGR03936 family radical SAM-associated protein [Bacillota bacterium]
MGRYLLKFSKEDRLKYISHLDLLRLFQRAFKRAQIKLKYSQGYNPHARIAFALPLSLGFESGAEYMEFETEIDYPAAEALKMLQAQMPAGLGILSCTDMAETSKTPIAAALDFASYKVVFKGTTENMTKVVEGIRPFMKQEQIMNKKFSKKKKKEVESDIRPHIHSITTVKGDDKVTLSMMLRTGSRGNLNAEVLVEELCKFCEVPYERAEWSFRRTEMYYEKGRNLVELSQFKG